MTDNYSIARSRALNYAQWAADQKSSIHAQAAIAFAILDLADALRPQPVPVNVKVDLDSEAVQEAVRVALTQLNRRTNLSHLSRESHPDSPHGDGFVETRGDE